jgi:hypothetical protein
LKQQKTGAQMKKDITFSVSSRIVDAVLLNLTTLEILQEYVDRLYEDACENNGLSLDSRQVGLISSGIYKSINDIKKALEKPEEAL